MGVLLEKPAKRYVIHDTREFSGQDAVYHAAVDLADEVMDGIFRLNQTHTLMAASLFITNRGAQLLVLTRTFDTEPINYGLDSILKRVTYDPVTGNLFTYAIPILEVSSGDNSSDESLN